MKFVVYVFAVVGAAVTAAALGLAYALGVFES